jgi:hypothetical protein
MLDQDKDDKTYKAARKWFPEEAERYGHILVIRKSAHVLYSAGVIDVDELLRIMGDFPC